MALRVAPAAITFACSEQGGMENGTFCISELFWLSSDCVELEIGSGNLGVPYTTDCIRTNRPLLRVALVSKV